MVTLNIGMCVCVCVCVCVCARAQRQVLCCGTEFNVAVDVCPFHNELTTRLSATLYMGYYDNKCLPLVPNTICLQSAHYHLCQVSAVQAACTITHWPS